MNNKKDKKPESIDRTESQYLPFVNEECGDTMWDAVLQEAEEKLKKAITQKAADGSPKKLYQGDEQ